MTNQKTNSIPDLVSQAQGKKCDLAWREINPIPCTLDEWRCEWRRQYIDKPDKPQPEQQQEVTPNSDE